MTEIFCSGAPIITEDDWSWSAPCGWKTTIVGGTIDLIAINCPNCGGTVTDDEDES